MATTGAVLYIKPRLSAGSAAGHKSGAVLYIKPRLSSGAAAGRRSGAVINLAPRVLSGIYTGGAEVTTEDSDASLKAWLPPALVPVVDSAGRMTSPWYRFFNYLVNQRLGGITAPSVTDIVTSVEDAQSAVTTTVSAVTALAEVTNQNSQVAATTREVAVNNNLSGASQIPQPTTYNGMIP